MFLHVYNVNKRAIFPKCSPQSLNPNPPWKKNSESSSDHEKLTRAYSWQLPDGAFLTFWPQTLYVVNDETNC